MDHIIPLCQAPHLKFEESNLQVLCKSCHAKKAYTETIENGKNEL
ncbi:HNH endonuclease [Komagataeibacter kakiaceti]